MTNASDIDQRLRTWDGKDANVFCALISEMNLDILNNIDSRYHIFDYELLLWNAHKEGDRVRKIIDWFLCQPVCNELEVWALDIYGNAVVRDDVTLDFENCFSVFSIRDVVVHYLKQFSVHIENHLIDKIFLDNGLVGDNDKIISIIEAYVQRRVAGLTHYDALKEISFM